MNTRVDTVHLFSPYYTYSSLESAFSTYLPPSPLLAFYRVSRILITLVRAYANVNFFDDVLATPTKRKILRPFDYIRRTLEPKYFPPSRTP